MSEQTNLTQPDNDTAHPQSARSEERAERGLSGAAACCPAVGAPDGSTPDARYFPDGDDFTPLPPNAFELDEDVPCPNCGAPLIRKSSTAIGVMWICGCGKSFFPEELVNSWPEKAGVFL